MDGISRRHGHYLPHWTVDEGIYFVTFRLADSMPREVVAGLEEEYRQLLRVEERALNRKLSSGDLRRINALRRNRIEKFLDTGHGACHLAVPDCAQIVKSAVEFFDGQRYLLGAWTVMPNHVHAILKPVSGHELDAIVRSWKKFTAREINKIVDRQGRLWQSEPFDHMVRSDGHFRRFSRYILDNPRMAGLAGWSWVGVGSLGPNDGKTES